MLARPHGLLKLLLEEENGLYQRSCRASSAHLMANQPQTQKRIAASHRSHEENSSQKRECFKNIYKIEDLFDMDIDQRLSQVWQKISSKKRLLVQVGKVNLAYRKFAIERNEDTSKIAWYKSFDLM